MQLCTQNESNTNTSKFLNGDLSAGQKITVNADMSLERA
jgi:hypothetical protein